ncbi:MAG: HAMP domain-containing histidine kinase [Burkholderiaceae bacterium]|nr:HAMP domain-containing histidine kinase [Burkholderiaceae bacterium]
MNTTAGQSRWARGFKGYSSEEQVRTAGLTRREDPRWRWVLPVTRSTRDFFIEQMPALVTTYCIAVALIFVAATMDRLVSRWLMSAWLLESVLSIAARLLILRRVFGASTAEVASRPTLRLLPLLAIVLAAIHWSWTATLFIGPDLNLTTVVVLLTYVMLSVACLGLAPASPVICAAYVVPMWIATGWMLQSSNWASTGVLVVLVAAFGGVMWSAFYIVVSGVRRYLVRSDEVDLLMNKLRDRNAEVEELRNVAAADLEMRSAVFASASHDLRQRIHAIKLIAHSPLASSAVFIDRPRLMRRLTAAIEDLEAFVTDVLHFVRFDSEVKPPKEQKVLLQDVLQRIEVQFEEEAASRQVQLRTRVTHLAVRTDPVMLTRIVDNLVSNGIKFTRGGVLVSARRRDEDVHLEVWDQGPGISSERLFTRAPAAAWAPSRDGFGLGLLIVRRLSDALGYQVDVHGRPGHGTRVRVVIPASDAIEETER